MKKKQSQLGSSHLVVIVVLVVALLGALGFVYWQNFMQPEAAVTPVPTVTENPTPVVSDGKKTLSISEWGVKGKYSNDEIVTYSMSGDDQIRFYSTSFPNNSSTVGCGGLINRLEADAKMMLSPNTVSQYYEEQQANIGMRDPNIQKVGEFYYLYITPQAVCGNSPTDPLEIANEMINKVMKEVVLSFEAI